MKRLYFTVTNDLRYDQRMHRICGTLAAAGYRVTLVGRKLPRSAVLSSQPFLQKRLRCFFTKGKLFYAEYNLRLLVFLLFKRVDLICAIDLDTIVPCYLISCIKGIPRVYDAHELFCEMKEIATRPAIYRMWKAVERRMVPRFPNGYTVNKQIAVEFERMYGVKYQSIRNVPLLQMLPAARQSGRYLLYQGAVNEGRCFETLIPAMRKVDAKLVICGTGNFFNQAKALARHYGVEKKLVFEGLVEPDRLRGVTVDAWAGITLFDNHSRSNYLSLGNRFFDYMQAGIPQLCVNYPAYREINDKYEVALLIDVPDEESIAVALRRLLADDELHARLRRNCLAAREVFNWEQEKTKLLQFYSEIIALG